MMTSMMKPNDLQALPKLSTSGWTVSWGEGLRLSVIVGSLSFVILAGQYAQSRGQDFSKETTEKIVASATEGERATAQAVAQVKAHKTQTALEKFATSQVRTYSELLDGLTERAETVVATSNVSPSESARLQATLHDLDENLMMAREALSDLRGTHAKADSQEYAFLEETLRGSLLNLQAAASEAQGQLIGLDRAESGAVELQSFKVSRIGQ